MALTKSNFLEYRQCNKSYWLRSHRPDAVRWPAPSEHDRMLMEGGYAVEAEAKRFVETWEDAHRCRFQVTYEADGLEARVDVVRSHDDGAVDIFEIKASTSTKDHIEDAAFQTCVVQRAGNTVRAVHIIHLNKEYERRGDIDLAALFIVADVSTEVAARLPSIDIDIDEALAFLALDAIDENGCSCVMIGNPSNHCAGFALFNPGIPEASAYLLPRISAKKLELFHQEGRIALEKIEPKDLTARQQLVLQAYLEGEPVINHMGIKQFLDAMVWPLHFYDYETFGAAVPMADGHRPYQAMPVQFSLHVLSANGKLEHFEYLAEQPGLQRELVEKLEACVHPTGSFISWNKSFEMTCNGYMAALLPDKSALLDNVNNRTVDLEDPFKEDYVDIGFQGSTSIKKVLPILVPKLAYSETHVHDGAGAMQAWLKYTTRSDEEERADLRRQLLTYCHLDSLAMVEIYRVLHRTIGGQA